MSRIHAPVLQSSVRFRSRKLIFRTLDIVLEESDFYDRIALASPTTCRFDPAHSGLSVIRPKHVMALEHPRSERRETQCSRVGSYAPRISKRLIKPFSI